MPPSRPPISAIIPTWCGLRYLPACLRALQAQLEPQDEVVLVDNASLDGAGAWAQHYAPEVRVVALPTNMGFAGGTAAGIAAARGELFLLINDDALAESNCVAALWAALQATPTAGMAAGVMTFSRYPEIVATAGIRFQRDGVATDHYLGAPVSALPTVPTPMFGASGGLALLRRELIADIGNFAVAFFNYLEDADLAWRARLRGWDCILAPQARVRHVYSASAGQGSPFKQRLLARNRIRLLVRCVPGPILAECCPQIVAYDLLAGAYGLLRGQPALAQGRLEALRELPALYAQRRNIQASRRASIDQLRRWIAPAPPPWAALRTARRLALLMR
ncbi:glycosyltransferase family 2 protein [Candidatus Viridilinea mediisalina]|uniref:Glycosyl transferase n=1 Tax=Candidatus Viridilinea mediisalina TaxID=2024553 RepID=A0A2A6RNB3_9CHLR|nr:glycosyltransferase [Candidatus Viridilinea mediisalina]PDW04527.1 glycosyl transferase [Candidatus Viridilinea mediisalina]